MVKQHAQVMNLLMGVCDLCVVAAAWGGAFELRFALLPHEKGLPAAGDVWTNLVIVLLVSLVVFAGSGIYKPRRDKSFLLEIGEIIRASVVVWGLLIVIIYFTGAAGTAPFTRGMLASFLPLMMAGLMVERGAFRSGLRYVRRRGWNLRHALIVGTGRLGQSVLLRLQRNSWTGIRVAGFIDAGSAPRGAVTGEESERWVRGVPVLGGAERVREIVEATGVDCVFVALPSKHGELLRRVIGDLEPTSVDVRVIPDLFLSRFPASVGVSDLDGMPIVSLREDPFAGWPSVYKRAFDMAGAVFGLALMSVPMLVIGVMIKLHDGGPILFRQRRISYGRRGFMMIKFRTMAVDAESAGPEFAAKDDPRCTRLGRILREWSLDELPQLLNVIRGDMSLVGPRPERPEMLDRIEKEVPGFPQRLKVRAGLTGWAQVNGYRGRTSFRKRLQYDLYYLNNWTPLLDLRIVAATVLRGFWHPNAY